MLITKNEIKFFKALQVKKTRYEEKLFIVEGAKSVLEALKSDFKVHTICVTEDFLKQIPAVLLKKQVVKICKESDLVSMGTFESNNAGLVVLHMKDASPISKSGLILVLDDISDPGNLGTIVRTADWFGVTDIVCSLNTTDFYSPKVINSTMGSFTRVNIHYLNLKEFFATNKKIVYGAFLGGELLGTHQLNTDSVLVIGNEAKGISAEVAQFVDTKVTIKGAGNAESLNASIATSILLYEFLG